MLSVAVRLHNAVQMLSSFGPNLSHHSCRLGLDPNPAKLHYLSNPACWVPLAALQHQKFSSNPAGASLQPWLQLQDLSVKLCLLCWDCLESWPRSVSQSHPLLHLTRCSSRRIHGQHQQGLTATQ